MYFNYHAKAKALINGGHLTSYEIVDDWNGIKPALVLHFDNNRSMPIREHKWDEYLLMLNGNNIQKEVLAYDRKAGNSCNGSFGKIICRPNGI